MPELGHEEQVREESGDEEYDTQDQEPLKITTYNEAIDSLENVACFYKVRVIPKSVFRLQFSYCFKTLNIETNYNC